MTRWPINHLTAEDLDAFHSASLSTEAREHLSECVECRTLLEQDRLLLAALAELPSFAPSPGFSDRVMAQVKVGSLASARRFAPRRVALAATLLLALGTSIAWSLFNRILLVSWVERTAASIGRTAWLMVRIVATNLAQQSWFAVLRETLASSSRLALLGSLLLFGYGAALFGLRKLLAVPSSVSHAQG